MRFVMLLALVPLSVTSACAATPTEPADGALGSDGANDPAPVATARPEPTAAAKPAGPAPTESAAASDDREITGRECQVLAQRYGDLTRSDAMAGLKPGLTAGQRQQAQQNILNAADKLSERWENGCVESLVGKVASEGALRCAMAAKTVADFDVCLNGPPAAPPP